MQYQLSSSKLHINKLAKRSEMKCVRPKISVLAARMANDRLE